MNCGWSIDSDWKYIFKVNIIFSREKKIFYFYFYKTVSINCPPFLLLAAFTFFFFLTNKEYIYLIISWDKTVTVSPKEACGGSLLPMSSPVMQYRLCGSGAIFGKKYEVFQFWWDSDSAATTVSLSAKPLRPFMHHRWWRDPGKKQLLLWTRQREFVGQHAKNAVLYHVRTSPGIDNDIVSHLEK